jgi:hypothetical protein
MAKKFPSAILAALILAILFAWSPWLTQASAKVRAVGSFNQAWEFVADGCGTNCKGCGAVSSRRVPFGVLVTIEYGCGMIPEDTSEYHERVTVIVSGIGTVHGIPKP